MNERPLRAAFVEHARNRFGVETMGLFKLAAVAALGIALLPADREQQEMLYNRAALAANWTITFCDRNAATCGQASGLWDQFVKKAEFGAKLAYDMMKDKGEASFETGAISIQAPTPKAPATTLAPSDYQPAWRGKAASKRD